MTRQRRLCARFYAFGLFAVVALVAGQSTYAAGEISPALLAAHQLIGAQQSSGLFTFEHDFIPERKRLGTDSNIGRMAYVTREAAAVYGLSNYYLYDQDKGVARTLMAALRKLGALSVPIEKAPGQGAIEATGILALPFGRYKLHDALQWLGLLYRPTGEGRLVSYDRTYESAWAGATALSLLTELQFYRASGDPRFTQLRQAWMKGLLVLYDSGRGFRILPGSIDENALSNGEIWLALASYSRLVVDDRATASILARVDDYMMQTYAAAPNAEFYSWGTLAAAQRLKATSDVRFRRFIAQQTRAYLGGIGPASGSSDNSCSAIEGLGTALGVLTADKDQALVRLLRRRIEDEMAKNRLLQIQPGQTRVEFGGGTYLSSPLLADYAGAFLAGKYDPYVRIDYTEHCISALLDLGERKH